MACPIVAHGPLELELQLRQAPSTMNVTLELWCIVSGDSRPFAVSVSTHDNISILKERIYEKNKNGVLRDIDSKDLDLWKVSSSSSALFIVHSNGAVMAYSLMFSS